MATESHIIEIKPMAVQSKPSLRDLSFTSARPDGGTDVWSPPKATDDWAAQCQVGREYGREAIDYIRSTGDHALLPAIARRIFASEAVGGVAVGFFTAISIELAS